MAGAVRTLGARVLDDTDAAALRTLLAADPVSHCTVAARVHAGGLRSHSPAGEIWGYGAPELVGACYSGANLVPVGSRPQALRAFADRARRLGRRCSSIVGPADAVAPLWEQLEPDWGPARSVRPRQPLLAIRATPLLEADPAVRRVRTDELDTLMPACISMFTEEVGVSPVGRDGGAFYRARVAEVVAAGLAFARIVDGRVVFKAEVGAVSPDVCQVQGVWVDPAYRGRGIGTAGMAAVVVAALRDIAPVVSLYVNDFNRPARSTYTRVGFERVGTFMSVLF